MMKNNAIWLSGLLVVGVLLSNGCDDPTVKTDPPANGSTAGQPADVHADHATVEITTENFDELVMNSNQPVLLDFWAEWCGPCVALAPTMEKLAKEYDGQLVVGKVNVDEQEDLGVRFNISSIPALIYFKDGEVVKTTIGGQSYERLKEEIEDVIQ